MVYGIIGLLALLIDQFLKFWTVSNVDLNTGIQPLIPGFLHITYIKNFGAAFGLFSGAGWLRWVLLVLLLAFTAAMVYAFIKGYFRTGFVKVSGALLLAGLLGNGIDRAIYGYVPDIFEFEPFRFAIFNLADMLVLFGGILFVVAILTGGLRAADEYDDYEEEEVPVRRARSNYDDEPTARRAPRPAEEAPVRRTAPRTAPTAAPSARGTAAPSPARERAAGNGVPAAAPRVKRVIDESTIPVPVRPARTAAAPRTAAPQRTAEPVRRPANAPAAQSRADLAAQNEATVRTVARPAQSAARVHAAPAAPKAAPAPVREAPKAAPAPAKEAPKASTEEFDLDSILAEFK